MWYRILLIFLAMLVMFACGEGAIREVGTKNLLAEQAPTLPPNPILSAAFTVGTLPQSSNVSFAGEYQLDIPLDVPPGRASMAPSLSLTYSSGTGLDSVGLGFSLRGASSFIRHCAPTLASHGRVGLPDTYCLDGQFLIEIAPGEWRTEKESFAKIIATPQGADMPTQWEVRTKEGRIRIYKAVQYDGAHTRFWALASESDRVGHRIDYVYKHEEKAPYQEFVFDIERIEYTAVGEQAGRRKVEFHYDAKPNSESPRRDFVRVWDPPSKSWHRRNVSGLLTSIEMYGPDEQGKTAKQWSYALAYEPSADTGKPLLVSIAWCGALGGCLQTRAFRYGERAPGTQNTFTKLWEHIRSESIPAEQICVLDATGDGKDDVFVALGLSNTLEALASSATAIWRCAKNLGHGTFDSWDLDGIGQGLPAIRTCSEIHLLSAAFYAGRAG